MSVLIINVKLFLFIFNVSCSRRGELDDQLSSVSLNVENNESTKQKAEPFGSLNSKVDLFKFQNKIVIYY